MRQIALLAILIASGFAIVTGISLSPSFYNTRSLVIEDTNSTAMQPLLINNVTTQSSLVNESQVEFRQFGAMSYTATEPRSDNKFSMFDLFFSRNTFVTKLVPLVTDVTRYSVHTAVIMMQGITLVLVITAFISVLCSYTSYCFVTYEGLQVREITDYYGVINSILKMIEEGLKIHT
ncbi:uncharacterized protein LOC109853242 [Pseudomyrmex gracilis]|uniref:uncharacterized protein LOC109853242 n=1 Tax=Pseudomyrmex gracilis TaxID=219809 RepID=UPI000995403A|nr:uncharacterized protein LOC109853242 [Pseudomyrmex gracilis]